MSGRFVLILAVLAVLLATASGRVGDRIESLPGMISPLPNKMYSGYVEVNSQYQVNLFYLFVESSSPTAASDPVVVWLQGGPGCSSLFGNWVENGPALITLNGTFVSNPWAWTTNASVLYVDQPVGAGFSYAGSGKGYVTNEQQMAEELYTLLATFFSTLHPEYSGNDLYLFGESYGGKWLPSISTYILAQASNPFHLAGVGIGDGWIDPYVQTGSYAPFLQYNGLIGQGEVDIATAMYDVYKGLVDTGLYTLAASVEDSLLEALVLAAGNVDVYNINYKGDDPTDVLSNVLEKWLDTPAVRQELGVPAGLAWQSCDSAAYQALINDVERSEEDLLAGIIQKVPLMLYSGNRDLICNFMGTNALAQIIDWPGQQQFNAAANTTLYDSAGANIGYWWGAQNLTRVVIDEAGHMVPANQPEAAWWMLYSFINGKFAAGSD